MGLNGGSVATDSYLTYRPARQHYYKSVLWIEFPILPVNEGADTLTLLQKCAKDLHVNQIGPSPQGMWIIW
jgi:hypothetical protein